jgi:hypothetical protein
MSSENTQTTPVSRTRAPRKCGLCREPCHNRNNCPNTPRQLLWKKVTDILAVADTSGIWRRPGSYVKIFDYVNRLSDAQVTRALMSSNNVLPIVDNCIALMRSTIDYRIYLHNLRRQRQIETSAARSAIGKERIKKIAVVIDCCAEHSTSEECFICCERVCSVKTGCGHGFCAECVVTILDTSKDKPDNPCCSFCKTPFTKITTENPVSHKHICDFIENLA